MGIGAGITPKGPSTPDNPSVTAAADSSLYTREPWDGDADCHVGPAGLLAMTTVFCHSEAGAHTGRGNPSFYDGRGCGPPRSSAPTEGLPKSQQWADVPKAWPPPTKFRAEIWGVGQVVGPYGKPDQPPIPRARGREGWAGIDARTIPKGGPPPAPPRQRLARRKARKESLVKFGLCPTSSECSTAQKVRKSHQSPARAHVEAALTEQDGLEPRPVVQEDAKRPGCTTRTRFFF